MTLRVRDVLELPELAASKVLAGPAGLDRQVLGVTVIDAPDGIAFIRGGELVLSTLFLYRDTEGQLALVRELNRRGGAGLGVKLQRFVDSLAPEVTRAAEDATFPIVRLPDALAWMDIINPVLNELLGRKTRELERSWGIQRHFISLALEAASAENLARELAKLVRRPVIIVNGLTGRTVTVDFPLPLQAPWRCGEGEVMAPLPERSTLVRIESAQADQSRVVCRVGNDQNVDGWVIVQDREADLATEDLVAMEQAAVALALEVQKLRAVSHVERSVRDDLVHHLLTGDFQSEAAARDSLAALGWELAPAYVAVVFEANKLPAAWTGDWGACRVGWRILDLLASEGLPAETITEVGYQERPVALIPVGEEGLQGQADRQVAAQVAGMIRGVSRRQGDLALAAGVGRPRAGILAVKESYREALTAVELAPVVPDRGPVVLFRELGLFRLVGKTGHGEVAGFIRDTIGPALKHDREQRAELTPTLRTFLDHGGNYRETAKALHVHHNTVRYRLALVEKLCHVDLAAAEDRFNLQLAVRLWLASRLYAGTKQTAENSYSWSKAPGREPHEV